MDVTRLRESFKLAGQYGDQLAVYFYADLTARNPGLRHMFPVSMADQRRHLIAALSRIVAYVDRPDTLAAYVHDLGLRHYRYEAAAAHFPAVWESLHVTLKHFAGDAWTSELAADWAAAYAVISGVMTAALDEAAEHGPPWWPGMVISAEQRTPDVTVLQVTTDPPLTQYLPGQWVRVETSRRPRLRRRYSIACPPRAGILEFHIQATAGEVSLALAGLEPGDELRLGPAGGALTLDPQSGRDLLMVAAGTGLAPLKAILGQVTRMPAPPLVTLFYGARRQSGLYDLDAMEKLAADRPWLTVIPVAYTADGPMHEVIAAYGHHWAAREAFLAGPSVGETAARLVSCGVPREQVHIEDFGWAES